jgi:hypothetical protein
MRPYAAGRSGPAEQHASENELNDYPTDAVIYNDGDLDQLRNAILG